MSRFDSIFAAELDRATARGVRRRLRSVAPDGPGRVIRDGRSLIDFSSNDYLGLAQHPALIERARDWTARFGSGSRASRLITGAMDIHAEVEAKVARAKGCEAAIVLASGWQLNAAVLPALFKVGGPDVMVFADKLIHASLHQGCAAAGIRQIRFRHNDLDHLESLLEAEEGKQGLRFILAETVYSMDGDRADVVRLADLAERYGAFLYLDEAHAVGVLGPGGMGLSGLAPGRVDLVMGTFSKALGGFGAYVAGSATVIDYLVNRCSGFVYTTAPPPAVLGAMDAALDLIPTLSADRARLARYAEKVRHAFAGLGVETGGSTTHIVPGIVGEPEHAVALSQGLEARGLLGVAIRPPTVPPGTSRIRFALTAGHSDADIEALISGMEAVWPGIRAAA
jgi:8-amino-7-oxononanoate synthase